MANAYDDLVAQAHRLLRVKWESPASLAEELYAMLMPPVGAEMPGDTEIPPRPDVAEIQKRLEQAQQFFSSIDQSSTVNSVKVTVVPPPALERTPPVVAPPPPPRDRPPEPQLRPFEVPTYPLPQQPFLTTPATATPPFIPGTQALFVPFSPALPIAPQALSYSRPDLDVPRLPDLDWTVPVANIPFGSGGGGGGILGLVVGGGGDTYTVDLYENGRRSAATQSGVTVIVPQIADGEDIPDGTWIAPILQVTADSGNTEYYYQAPVWLR